jgi:transposase
MIPARMHEADHAGAATVEALNARVLSLQEAITEHERRAAQLCTEIESLKTHNERLRAHLSAALKRVFGRSSEKQSPEQLRMTFASLLDEAAKALLEGTLAKNEAAPAADASPKERKKREEKPRGAAAHPSVRRERETKDPDPADRTCAACKEPLCRIGEDVSSSLEWIPGHFLLKETALGKWACGCGEGGVVTPPAPPKPIAKSIASASFLAHVAVSKYQDHLPLTRLTGIFERVGVTIPISTLADWMHQTASLLGPIRETLKAEILAGDLVRLDDTRLEMQRNSKGEAKKRCYLWEYRDEVGATVFDFTLTRSGAEPARFLEGFRGIIQSDGYSAHDQLFAKNPSRRRAGCWAHARRRMVEAMETAPVAAVGVALIGRLYDVERDAKIANLGPIDRSRLRRERCPPILAMLRSFLDDWSLTVLPKSPLGEAVGYILSQWQTLQVYVEEGRVAIDNNEVEAAIRGIALGRKSHLFVGSEQGGHDAAVFYTVIESCKAADVEPMAYLQDVIGRAATLSAVQLGTITPARWKADRDAAARTSAIDAPSAVAG